MHIITCKWCLIPYSATREKARGSENLDVVCRPVSVFISTLLSGLKPP